MAVTEADAEGVTAVLIVAVCVRDALRVATTDVVTDTVPDADDVGSLEADADRDIVPLAVGAGEILRLTVRVMLRVAVVVAVATGLADAVREKDIVPVATGDTEAVAVAVAVLVGCALCDAVKLMLEDDVGLALPERDAVVVSVPADAVALGVDGSVVVILLVKVVLAVFAENVTVRTEADREWVLVLDPKAAGAASTGATASMTQQMAIATIAVTGARLARWRAVVVL